MKMGASSGESSFYVSEISMENCAPSSDWRWAMDGEEEASLASTDFPPFFLNFCPYLTLLQMYLWNR